MKKLLAVVVLGFVVFVVMFRQRLYLRDPLATVTRNGVKLGGVTVMINYSNDVLVDDGSGGTRRLYLVQHWSHAAGVPLAVLKCVQGVACMTDADQASMSRLASKGPRAATMTDKVVEFVDEAGVPVRVALR